jgi:hypothetical protein
MVVLGIMSLIFFLLSGTVGVLPTGNFGLNGWATSVVGQGLFSHLAWANAYLPLDQVVAAVGALLALFAVMLTVRMVIWALTKVHVLGGGGD